MMRQKIILLLLLLSTTHTAFAIKLDEQIKQNVEQAKKSYEQLINQEPPRLWIQVRTQQQQQLLQHISDWLKPISLIKVESIQLVKEGPKKTQLRFFSSQDKERANDLFKKLQKTFPQLELLDLSEEYGAMSWMEEGHFELWLAPDLKRIELLSQVLPLVKEPVITPILKPR